MSAGTSQSPTNMSMRERRRNRMKAPLGDEDIPIVFAGSTGRELFHRRLSANRKTAFFHDDRMLLHKNEWYSYYPECPDRAKAVFHRCQFYDLLTRCLIVSAEPVAEDALLYVHNRAHIAKMTETEVMADEERKELSKSLDSAFFNAHTNLAARLAVGSVIQAVDLVHRGDVRNAFCSVRPPGHHAMEDEACGFCIFNNIAVAAEYAMDKLEYNRILILDWDVHHGQATQYAFYDSSRVLYISIHRYDEQRFWPCLRESNFDFIGSGRGLGYNINIPLNDVDVGDADYLAIFHQLILPVAYEFDPELILVSAGYDCAYGCPLGQLKVSPPLFAHLTHKLMGLAEGKLVMVLEGGYCCDSLSEGVAHTISALLGDPMPSLDPPTELNPSVIASMHNCVSALNFRWRSLHVFQLPEHIPASDFHHLPEQSWQLVKVPTIEPEGISNSPEKARRITEWLEAVKCTHSAARRPQGYNTCMVYDTRMENHKNEEDRTHPETPHRIRRAYELLDEYGLARRCKRVEARYASRAELLRVHTATYVDTIAKTAVLEQSALNQMGEDEESVYFNRHTYDCARLASGSVLAVVDEVCSGRSLNGVAVVRPPGHHALADRCMGFCFFNNVAVGARHAQQVYGLDRVAIVDWDVHHGNGTEKIFEDDPSVLFISVHRFDDGRFFPNSSAASPSVCGVDAGMGKTVQVGWNGRQVRDGEYISAFTHVILPILYEFRPQLILVSAGFDSVRGDRLGGLNVSAECFAHLTHLLLTCAYLCPNPELTLARQSTSERTTRQRVSQLQSVYTGGLILVLEGGYHLSATAEALCHSVSSLLGDCCPRLSFGLSPTEKGCKAVRRSLSIQEPHWKLISGYGAVRGQIISDDLSRLSISDEHRPGTQSALAYTAQQEAQVQSRLENVRLHDDISPRFNSPVDHVTPINSTSFTLTVIDPIGMGTMSSSIPSTTLPTVEEHQTAQESVTNVFESRLCDSGGQSAPATVIPAYPVTQQSATGLPQLADEFSRLHVSSPFTGFSDRSSVASEVIMAPDDQLTRINGACPSGSAGVQSSSSPGGSSGNQVLAVATLQDLMNVANPGSNDMHAFFGLECTEQLPEQLFAVVPLTWCPHLTAIQSNPDWRPDIHEACASCENVSENWVCLTCYSVYCGRYANSHMLDHFTLTKHPMVLSFSDLSSWCYVCEAYVHNEALSEAKRSAHTAKFGIDVPQV